MIVTRICLITNIPAPYREKIYEIVSLQPHIDLTVIYCAPLEPNRQWTFEYGEYNRLFLSEANKNFVHNNPHVWNELSRLNPDVVITSGFNPTMLYSFLWCVLHKKKHITFTDGTLYSESHLSFIHKFIRKIIFRSTKAFIGPSNGSTLLYKSYGIPNSRIFTTKLSIANNNFNPGPSIEKDYDVMFSGQLIEGKLPLFFVKVVIEIKNRIGKCRVLILGDGVLKEQVLGLLEANKIDYCYPGFVKQSLLPNYYPQSKIFLFPTKNDTWGIVANEAMASGLPVITCANAGVADDLVIHNRNGYVLPLDVNIWAEHSIKLLHNAELYKSFSDNAYKDVQQYNFENAAQGIINAIESV